MRQTRSQAKLSNPAAADTNGNTEKKYEEIKNIIYSFNNKELNDLLGLPYNNKQKKSILQASVLGNWKNLEDRIRAVYNNRKVVEQQTPMYHQDLNMVVSQQGNGTTNNHSNGTNNGVVVYNQTIPQQSITPVNANIRLKKLAFFDVLATLMKPTPLHVSPPQRVQEGTYYFALTPDQATDIAKNRDISNVSKIEHVIQVQLRFCLLETSCEQDDIFPPNVVVKVNNKLCPLPNPIPTNKPGMEAKRPPRPVNITPNVKLSPSNKNEISISWCTEYTRGYVISVYLVKKLTSAQLLHRMKTKGIKLSESTRTMIKEKLNEDADCEIATTMLKVSLVCPLGKMRMTTPCRATSCSHLQCFDALTYLQMNEKKPTWNCPVCDKPANYDNLEIDGYFQEVLSSPELSSDTNEIQLNKDGSWSTHILGSDSLSLDTPCKKYQSVEVISDDLEVITETRPAAKITPMALNEPTSTTTSSATIETSVDLTQSDSDEDMPLRKSQPPPKQVAPPPNVNVPPASRTNDVSIITLDSPTPPSSPVNNISSVYVDTQSTGIMNTNTGVSSTTHNNWTNQALNSLTNYNLLPSSPLLQDPLGGALADFYQRQLLQNNSPNFLNPYASTDEDNRY